MRRLSLSSACILPALCRKIVSSQRLNGLDIRRVIHDIAPELSPASAGLFLCYALRLLTDEEFRQDIEDGWPMKLRIMMSDYVSCSLFTLAAPIYYWRSREKARRKRGVSA